MNKSKTVLLTVIFFCTILFTGTLRTAAEVGEGPVNLPIAEINIGANGIGWMPKVEYAQLVLSISCPDGMVLSKTFQAGNSPYLEMSEQFTDGTYTYELTAVPILDKNRSRVSGIQGIVPKKTVSQTGYFSVMGGKFVTSSAATEGMARPKDILHYDDVIITGSLCVGFDCADGESFGFDTIILKEHNLRIYFNDTSYTASYPTNNWRITINDSTNGGASYFSVDDVDDGASIFKIEAGAPSNSLYVEDYGRVGLGTSTPVVELHIKDSDTPTLRLEQDSSGGWTAQTFDVAGNESNFFIRDATNGSKLPFRIQPNTPSSTLCLKSDGYVGIGTWSPSYPVHLETSSGTSAEILAEQTGGAQAQLGAAASLAYFGARTNHEVRFNVNSTWRMRLNPTTDSTILEMSDGGYYDGTWHGSSSRKLKKNIRNLSADEAMDALTRLTPVKFHYKTNKEDEHVGFIAEDVPDLVASKYKTALSAMDVVAVLTKVVKEQQKMVQEQQKTIAELKKEIIEIKKK